MYDKTTKGLSMPQLKNIARFTTRVNLNDTKDTPIPTTFRATHRFTEIVYLALTKQTQPVSVLELTELVSREANHPYDETYVRVALKELAKAGKVSFRKETFEERSIRANGAPFRSMRASLYWSPAGIVPPRTVTEAVTGLSLYKDEQSAARKTYKYPAKKKKLRMEEAEVELIDVTPVQSNSNAVVDYLIEKMVAERTTEIQSQLDVANGKLAKLQELFKSAL